MELEPSDDLEVNLETEVMTALSRLQKKNMGSKCKNVGVSRKNIVKFLKTNCSWLDGDLDSQVMTALLSCVKMGVVCVLEQGSYRLVNPTSKNMISKCVNLVSHGPKCSCLTTLRGLSSYRRPCCVVRGNSSSPDKKTRERNKRPAEQKCQNNKKRKTQRKTGKKCDLRSMEISLSKCDEYEQKKKRCDYCLEIHYIPHTRKSCGKHKTHRSPCASYSGVPMDTFSPRDEISIDYNYK